MPGESPPGRARTSTCAGTCLPAARPIGTTATNPHGKYVVAPLVLRQRSDRTLACTPFEGWSALESSTAQSLAAPPATAFRNAPSEDWQLKTAPGELDVLATDDAFENFRLTATLTLDAPVGGLGFRLDGETGGGYFLEIEEGSDRVSLQKWVMTRDQWSNRPFYGWQELQRGRLRERFEPGTPLAVHLITNGPYIEIALDGEVVIATLSGERTVGPVGIWAESGSASLTDATITPSIGRGMASPDYSSR